MTKFPQARLHTLNFTPLGYIMYTMNRKRTVAIVVDSAASTPPAFRDSPATFAVPMLVRVGDDTYRDGVDLSASDFYAMQRRRDVPTSTSAPPPAAFLEAFEDALDKADAALCITVSARFSASAAAAETARVRLLERRPNADVRILDSQTAIGAQGLIATEALRIANTGADLDAVERAALKVRERVRLLAYVDTLRYLWKGGRVPAVAHLATSALRIKPVFELRRSETTPLARPRTARRAVARLLELTRERAPAGVPLRVSIMNAAAPERADMVAAAVRREYDCAELYQSEVTPVMGAHIGPGMVAVAFWGE